MIYINIYKEAGLFAENKDISKRLREKVVLPNLRKNEEITLDFEHVEGANQSFIHSLISEAIREFGPDVLDHIVFKSCNGTVQEIITIVVDYMQAS